MLRIAIVTNNPPPYRVPVFQRLGRIPGIDFQAIFCSHREPNRFWDLPPMEFDHVFLRERFYLVNGRCIHHNPDVVGALFRFAPEVVITDGFNPTHLYAFLYAWGRGLAHVAMTDGTDVSEQSLGFVHKAVRRFVYARSGAFVPASIGGKRHYQSYGVPADRCFTSCLCIDNEAFAPKDGQAKQYDFIFSGRFEAVKNPLFAMDVAVETAKQIGRKVNMLFVGSGSLEESMRAAAKMHEQYLAAVFHGFAAQRELPSLYRSARVLLFPTSWDPWGVVANEACAAGLPVLVSKEAGVAGELVRDGENGFVCTLESETWAKRAAMLLMRPVLYEDFSRRSLRLVSEYNYDNAASGIVDACRFSLRETEPIKVRMPV